LDFGFHHSFVIRHLAFKPAYLWRSARNQQCCAP
jgi:hypothetical protein